MELDLALRAVAVPAVAMAMACWLLVLAAGRIPLLVREGLRGTAGPSPWPVRWALTTLAVLPVAWALGFQEPSWRDVTAPSVSYQWLGWAAVLSALVSSAVATGPGRAMSAAAAIVASLAACVMVKPPGLTEAGPKFAAALASALGGAGAAMASTRASSGTERTVPAWATFVGWWACLAVASGMVLLSGFAKLAVTCGALSASAAAWAVMTAFVPRLAGSASAVSGAFAATLGVLCLVARGYDEAGFPSWCWWMLAVAPGAGAAAAWTAHRGHPRIAAAIAVAAPPALALAALLAARSSVEVPAGSHHLDDDAMAGVARLRTP